MIRVLDKHIADKIAAGEVIERPVSAVKELVENSIDAGAGSIIVEIRSGGKSYIGVTDDGCGISPEEVETAFLRHATSKIESITDLDNIRSLGFRGEALASIAAVSKITIVTRTPDRNAGVRLMMHGGRVLSKETAGANAGTTIVVEDLFYNTPARRKFMGTDAREGSAVIELLQQYAICYPYVKFMVIRNGETVFTTRGDGNTLQTIQSIYPDTDHAGLISVSGAHVSGFISDPGTVKSTRRGQLFFVNGRLVDSKIIEKGLSAGYGGRVFSGYPVAILFIDADPSDIDVNIHPGKREIRFLKAQDVSSDITSAVSNALMSRESVPSGIMPHASHSEEPEKPVPQAIPVSSGPGTQDPSASYSTAPMYTGEQSSIRDYLGSLKRNTLSSSGQDTVSQEEPQSTVPDSDDTLHEWVPSVTAPSERPFSFDELVYRGYLFDAYIVMQSADTVYLFDQHAAHERIFYERFTEHYLKGEKFTQPILTPITISVSADVYYMSREWLAPLERAGYDIEDFGADTFIIRGIPSYMDLSEAVSFAQSYLEALEEASGLNDIVIDKLIMRSCKSAVKAGEHLSEPEIKDLIDSLAECKNPYCCPHGRPVFIRYTKYEIERSFKRK